MGWALSVTLLPAGELFSAGTVLWAGLGGLWCLWAQASLTTDQLNFARDALSESLCM